MEQLNLDITATEATHLIAMIGTLTLTVRQPDGMTLVRAIWRIQDKLTSVAQTGGVIVLDSTEHGLLRNMFLTGQLPIPVAARPWLEPLLQKLGVM